ncbi:MAG: lipoyl(octanoyl) transferase LipB [Bacteroidota bacterium]
MQAFKNTEVTLLKPGLIEYGKAWDWQESVLKEVVKIKVDNRSLLPEDQVPTPNFLIFCRHPNVFTLGKSGHEENLLADADFMAARDAVFFKSNRGGDITYHGPGQLVGYPILDLENFFTDIHKYMRYLEEVIILTCAEYGLNAGRVDGQTGVWVDGMRKICAFGVRTSRWVTMHGFALNINTDLSYFSMIVPCGITDKGVTSLQNELGRYIDEAETEKIVLQKFEQVFGMKIKEGISPDVVPV